MPDPLDARSLTSGYDPAALPSLPQRVLPRMNFAMVNGQMVPADDGPDTSPPPPDAPLATSRDDVDPEQLGALVAQLAHGSTNKSQPFTPPQQSSQPPLAVSHAPTALNPPPPPSAWQHAESIRASQAGDTFVPRSFTEVMAQEGGLPRMEALREYLFGGAEQPTDAIRAQPVPESVTKGFPVTPPGGTPAWRGPNAEHYLGKLPVATGDAPLPMGHAAEALADYASSRFPQLATDLRSGLVAPSGEAIEDVLARRGASGLAVAPEDSHLLYAPATRLQLPNGETPLHISSRVPWTLDRNVAPTGVPLVTDWNVVKTEAPEIIPKLAQRLGASPLLTEAEASQAPEQVVESFINRAKDNLLWLWDQTPSAIRGHAQQWYEGAHARALEDAPYLRVTPDQSAASIAALSPQNDWFTNAELARRVGYTWREFEDHNPAFTSDLFDQYRQMVLNTNAAKLNKLKPAARTAALRELEAGIASERQQFQGQTFKDLPLAGRARMIRAFSQEMHPRQFPMILPSGGLGDIVKNADGRPARLGWSVSYPMLENAISALDDGSPENLSRLLGDAHKVRSFYNNIIHPYDPHSVTIDTHAVAAAHLSPFAQSEPEVNYAMSGIKHGRSGIIGSNAIYAEAYKRAAAERGVLPRQMQSVTWESLRGMFSPSQKDDAQFVSYIKSLWDQHRQGTLSLDQVRDAVHYAAGGITEPPWARTVVGTAPR